MKQDNQIFDLIAKKARQRHGLELIASENYVSEDVLRAMGASAQINMQRLPGKRYWRLPVCRPNRAACHRPAQGPIRSMLGKCSAAFRRPGQSCSDDGNPQSRDTFMGLDLSQGGHLTHGSPVNSSGSLYNAVAYGLDPETGMVDYDKMEQIAKEHKPKLIIGGASAYSREWDYERMRKIADEVGAILWVDMAHPAGLIAAGLLKNPVKYAHVVTSTTHKTLRGPRGGIILMGEDFLNPKGLTNTKGEVRMMSAVLDSYVFPGVQGGPLEHVIASKAVAFWEASQSEFVEYQKQVIANAAAMCKEFLRLGYKVVSGGTDNHLMLIDLRTKFPKLSGRIAEKQLEKADITVNKNMVPFDSRSPFQTSGLRIGTPAITSRGFVEADMPKIVELIEIVLQSCNKHIEALSLKKADVPTPEQTASLAEHKKVLASVSEKVHAMTAGKPLNRYQ